MSSHENPANKELLKPLTWKEQFELMAWFLGILWVLELVDTFLLNGWLDGFGIQPRTLEGLWGVIFAPMLHGDLGHLLANSFPLMVLGWLTLSRGFLCFARVSVTVTLIGGLGVWLVGADNSIHLGASILIFGYLGFLLGIGLRTRTLRDILTSLIVGALYGSMVWGVLPGDAGISWEGHLFGFLGGVLSARQSATQLQ